MSSSSIVAVAMFQSHQEASMAQAALAAEAIDSELAGSVTADTLAYFGSATGGVRLLVKEQDTARAEQILESIGRQRSEPARLPEWRCPACGEDVDGAFDLCWSCGELKPEAAAPVESPRRDEDSAELNSAEALIDRAWRAAVLGIVLFPLLAYALVLIFRASRVPSQQPSWKSYGTLLIVCAMGLFWWIMLSGFGWR